MNEHQIREILEKFQEGKASEEELAFLESWYLEYYAAPSEEMPLMERIATTVFVWARLQQQTQPKVRPMLIWRRMAAAVLVLIIGLAAYLLWNNNQTLTVAELANTQYDVPPGANRATVTDAMGKVVELDTARTGIRVHTNALSYDNGAAINELDLNAAQAVKMMTLQTPKGGTYQIILPDGTKVWLNAATSLQFPSSFQGAERRVALNGEAYFEVVPNKQMPFRVASKGQTVEVLGTSFNVNCYPDEQSIQTTLIEGKVRIGAATLMPGHQAINNGTNISIREVNTDAAVGWKNNYFVFQGEKIESIMRKISRWYDMEIVYETDITADDFGGRVNRYVNVSQVLKKLELTNKVHFKISGKTIIVTK